jgi:hypothetical protein
MGDFFRGQSSPTTFGIKVNSVNGIPADIESVKGSIVKTNKQYREEISKYKEIAKFNQQISNGYIKNLEAMVDISRVLNYYIEIFTVLRDEFEKNEKELGNSLKTEDISYLENITRSKIDQLNTTFFAETEKLKKIYSQYGKTAEVNRLQQAQMSLEGTIQGAEQAWTNLKQIQEQAKSGGKNTSAKKQKKTPKKTPKKSPKVIVEEDVIGRTKARKSPAKK